MNWNSMLGSTVIGAVAAFVGVALTFSAFACQVDISCTIRAFKFFTDFLFTGRSLVFGREPAIPWTLWLTILLAAIVISGATEALRAYLRR
jgi:hypothetical protein